MTGGAGSRKDRRCDRPVAPCALMSTAGRACRLHGDLGK